MKIFERRAAILCAAFLSRGDKGLSRDDLTPVTGWPGNQS